MFNPPISHLHDGYADVSALLQILADPVKTKQRLDELVAQEKAVDEKIASHNELVAETRGMHSAAEATNIVLNNRKTALDAREAEIELKAQALTDAETMKSDAALGRRERAVAAREESASREADRLAALRTEYESKIARFKKLHQESAL
jgi:hypothetical protein